MKSGGIYSFQKEKSYKKMSKVGSVALLEINCNTHTPKKNPAGTHNINRKGKLENTQVILLPEPSLR